MNISTISIFTVFIISVVAEKTTVMDSTIYNTDSLLYTVKNNVFDIHTSMSFIDKVFIVEKKLADGSFAGLYSLEIIGDVKTFIYTKVLNNGQCTTSDNQTIFFGASDGIYTFNIITNKAERYGNITEDIRAIQKHSNKDIVYVLSNNKLNKITERGTKIQEVEGVNGVQEIVLDKDDNVYFYEERDANAKLFEEKYSKPKVIVGDKIIDVKGLPDKYNQIKITRSVVSTEGAILILNKRIYRIFPNGTSVATEFVFENVPTACFFDLGIILIFAHEHNLYHFDVLSIFLNGIVSSFSKFVDNLVT